MARRRRRRRGAPNRRPPARHPAAAAAPPPVEPSFSPPPPAPARAERALLVAVRGCAVALVAVPLVMTPSTLYPFEIGKALYARVTVEIAFALWAVLAAFRPAWRPPRSVLLAILAAAAVVALAAAWQGVSPGRSLWSTYGRSQGVVDTVHWVAAAVVLVSVFRTAAHWRALFGAYAAAGAVAALAAVASYYRVELPFYGLLPEDEYPRVSGTLGNPTYLGGYLVVVSTLAAGLAARALAVRRQRAAPGARRPRAWTAPAWGAVAGLAAWALTLSGSIGAFAGLAAAGLAVPALYALVSRRPRLRRLAVAGLAALAVGLAALAWSLVARLEPVERYADIPVGSIEAGNPLLARATQPDLALMPLRKRLDLWQAAARGFADRPVLGWGPGNFTVAFGRHTSGWGGATLIQDRAHGKLLEVAATQGAAGLAAYLALCGWLAFVLVRAAREADGAERRLVVFAGAALAGHFVHGQTLFDTASTSVGWVLLVGFAVHLETARAPRPWFRWSVPAVPLRRAAAGTLAALALALALAGAGANRDIYAAAAALLDAEAEGSERFMEHLARGIAAFEPLATQPRMILFENVVHNWGVLIERNPDEAHRLIRWADREAAAAVAAEPANWRLHQVLARMYTAAAESRPAYAHAAARHTAAVRALAPAIDPLERPGRPR